MSYFSTAIIYEDQWLTIEGVEGAPVLDDCEIPSKRNRDASRRVRTPNRDCAFALNAIQKPQKAS